MELELYVVRYGSISWTGCVLHDSVVFFFKQKTAYEMLRSLVGSEMCIRDRTYVKTSGD